MRDFCSTILVLMGQVLPFTFLNMYLPSLTNQWHQSKPIKTMTKEEFKALFDHALEVAAENAERKLGRSVPHRFEIEMHGLTPHSRVLRKDEAFEEIYLGP